MKQEEQIKADVDDEIYLLMKRIQLKYKLTWAKARDAVNKSIKELYQMPSIDLSKIPTDVLDKAIELKKNQKLDYSKYSTESLKAARDILKAQEKIKAK